VPSNAPTEHPVQVQNRRPSIARPADAHSAAPSDNKPLAGGTVTDSRATAGREPAVY
jgi:hypothetical protein